MAGAIARSASTDVAIDSLALDPVVCTAPSASGTGPASAPASGDDALAVYDDNRNGKRTLKEVRRYGIAMVPRSHPAYRYARRGWGWGRLRVAASGSGFPD